MKYLTNVIESAGYDGKYKLVSSYPLSYLSQNASNSVARLPSLNVSNTRFQELKKCKQPDLFSVITVYKNLQGGGGGGEGGFHISGPWSNRWYQ